MFKLVNLFKTTAVKCFEENISKVSKENSKRGKNKIMYLKIIETQTYFFKPSY